MKKIILIIAALLCSAHIYAQEIIIDSDITLRDALEGSSAPAEILSQMVLLNVEYYSTDSLLHRGQIVVNKAVENDIIELFGFIRDVRFPVESVIPVKFDKPDNGTSMDTLNNSYGFHYRNMDTSSDGKISTHSLGIAIDINPYMNPAILSDGCVIPKDAVFDTMVPGTLTKDSPVVRKLISMGWTWGGNWRSLKDYMHFERK